MRKAGELIGERYRINALLGKNKMGCIYHATDQVNGQDVAVKCFTPVVSQSSEWLESFIKAEEILTTIRHR
ncbi:MAG: hypothetical protein ACD_28C00041G0001, partial [uncultured bacterium]